MEPAPVGVVLAGGAGRRFGGGSDTPGGVRGRAGKAGAGAAGAGKAGARLGGRTLLERAVDALGAVVAEVVVSARADTALPELDPPVTVWREPADGPRHPLYGIAEALRRAAGRPVLVCAVDLPFVDPETLRRLLGVDGALAVLDGQPLVGRYPAGARAAVAELAPTVVAVEDPARTLFNVNTREDLERAQALLLLRSSG